MILTVPSCRLYGACVKPDEATWPERLNVLIGHRVQEFRRLRKLTAAQLATRCTELGLPISRSKIANLENGRARQEGVSIAEILALAAVLEVPAPLLLVALGSTEPIEVLPDRSVDPWLAYRWLLGEVPTNALGKDQDPGAHLFDSGSPHTAVIRTYRQHDGALMRYLINRGDDDQSRRARDAAIGPLAAARIKMYENGWRLPPLPQDVAEALKPALLAWGWCEQKPGTLVRLGFDATEAPDPTPKI
jgi:transcriptional regulator with XRE-family HTH domain